MKHWPRGGWTTSPPLRPPSEALAETAEYMAGSATFSWDEAEAAAWGQP
jgi:hypothetical protein